MAIPFKRINLNLILHLDALLSEKSVSAAAEKVFVSQPAMSSSLKQLRELFKDPLLIPGKGEYFLSKSQRVTTTIRTSNVFHKKYSATE